MIFPIARLSHRLLFAYTYRLMPVCPTLMAGEPPLPSKMRPHSESLAHNAHLSLAKIGRASMTLEYWAIGDRRRGYRLSRAIPPALYEASYAADIISP